MIFEVLLLGLWLSALIVGIIHIITRKKNSATVPIILAFSIVVLLTLFTVNTLYLKNPNNFTPVNEYSLQEIREGKYAVCSISQKFCFYMHDNNVYEVDPILYIKLDDTKYTVPTVIECKPNSSKWVSNVVNLTNKYYILVINDDQIMQQADYQNKQQKILPKWLTSHQGGFLIGGSPRVESSSMASNFFRF